MNICLVTGGAGALGAAIVRTLVGRSYRVAMLDSARSKPRSEALEKELGSRVLGLNGDCSEEGAWKDALAAITSSFGGAPTHAALVAGGWEGGAPIHAGSEDTYRKMMTANTDTVHRALRALLPSMVASKHGSIVVVGSRAVERPWSSAGASAYAASKAAAVTLAQSVAAEVLADGVRINAILPSTMDTPANRAAMPDVDPSTWVSVDSAAGVVAFLLSEDARDISGAAIPVYGRA